jgi:hypothetical protein
VDLSDTGVSSRALADLRRQRPDLEVVSHLAPSGAAAVAPLDLPR